MRKPPWRRCGPDLLVSNGLEVEPEMDTASLQHTEMLSSLNPFVKTSRTASSCCLSMIPGVVVKTRYAVSRKPESGLWLAWNSTPRSSGHCSPMSSTRGQHQQFTFRSQARIPLSVYCLATSANASPIFRRTSLTVSLLKQATSFSRMATRCSLGKLENTSLASPEAGSLRVFVAILRKSTAANARV